MVGSAQKKKKEKTKPYYSNVKAILNRKIYTFQLNVAIESNADLRQKKTGKEKSNGIRFQVGGFGADTSARISQNTYIFSFRPSPSFTHECELSLNA